MEEEDLKEEEEKEAEHLHCCACAAMSVRAALLNKHLSIKQEIFSDLHPCLQVPGCCRDGAGCV